MEEKKKKSSVRIAFGRTEKTKKKRSSRKLKKLRQMWPKLAGFASEKRKNQTILSSAFANAKDP